MNSKLFCSHCFLAKRASVLFESQLHRNNLLNSLQLYSTSINRTTKKICTANFPLFTRILTDERNLNSWVLGEQRRNAIKGGPGYTNFGHKRQRQKFSKFAYFWYLVVFGGITFTLFFDMDTAMFRGEEVDDKIEEMRRWYGRHTTPKAKEKVEIKDLSGELSEDEEAGAIDEGSDSEVKPETDDGDKKEKKEKKSFRDRKIIQYENRIRQYSTPDKVFRYFATLKVWNEKTNEYEVFMTPDDFVRSFTYGARQPESLGLDRYHKFDPKMQNLDLKIGEDSVFKHLSPQGIISFTDYIFLVTLLSTPPRHFEIAFQMFDLDGNGNIDIGEFEQLQTIIRNQTSLGQRHRDTRMTGSVIKENTCLNEYFFGSDNSQLLTVDKFIEFQKHLLTEVIKKEFEYCDKKTREDGTRYISEESFCEAILAYAGFSSSKMKKIIKRISHIYDENSPGITFDDYQDFFQVLRSIQDIETALKFYTVAGASIDKAILKHVSKTVANVDLSDHVVEVVFNLFDENGDGKLSNREFIKVMKKRWMRGLQTPKDTGFIKFIASVGQCTKETFFTKDK